MFGLFKSNKQTTIKDYFACDYEVSLKLSNGKTVKFNLKETSVSNMIEDLVKNHNLDRCKSAREIEIIEKHVENCDDVAGFDAKAYNANKGWDSNSSAKSKFEAILKVNQPQDVKEETNKCDISDDIAFVKEWLTKNDSFFISSHWSIVNKDGKRFIDIKDKGLTQYLDMTKEEQTKFKAELRTAIANQREYDKLQTEEQAVEDLIA